MIISWVVVRPFNELTSGVEMNEQILDEFQCPLLNLSNVIYLYPVSLVLTPVSIVHSCSTSCTFKTNSTRQIKCEKVQTDDFDFVHDRSNSLYSLNIYNINTNLFSIEK